MEEVGRQLVSMFFFEWGEWECEECREWMRSTMRRSEGIGGGGKRKRRKERKKKKPCGAKKEIKKERGLLVPCSWDVSLTQHTKKNSWESSTGTRSRALCPPASLLRDRERARNPIEQTSEKSKGKWFANRVKDKVFRSWARSPHYLLLTHKRNSSPKKKIKSNVRIIRHQINKLQVTWFFVG